MSLLAFHQGTVILADRLLAKAVVVCDRGRIVSIGKRTRLPKETRWIDLQGGYLCPGFVDLHVHGGGGADFMDGTVAAVRLACQTHLRHGTTAIFPTTTTGQPDELEAMLEACRLAKA
ncbi:MAG: amidohydrolase family protein, partial [Pirellulaceae bacterium]